MLQPVLVTETLDGYQLIAGERRVRAARLAGLERIPALVRQLADRDQLELALVENVQRADLDPIEEALAYRQLIDEFGLTPGGRRRARRARRGRPSPTRSACSSSTRTSRRRSARAGSARATDARSAGSPSTASRTCWARWSSQGLSVRQTEELVRRLREPRERVGAGAGAARGWTRTWSGSRRTCASGSGTKVSLARSRRGGRIVIEYYSDEELARLYERLIGGNA